MTYAYIVQLKSCGSGVLWERARITAENATFAVKAFLADHVPVPVDADFVLEVNEEQDFNIYEWDLT